MSDLANPIIASVVALALITAAIVVGICLKYGRRMDARVGAIHFEVHPNHGTSMKDAVDRIERKVDAVTRRVESLESNPHTANTIVVNQPAEG